MINLIAKLTDHGYTPLEAAAISRKLAQVQQLEEWAKNEPQMEPEERIGWLAAKSRILDISQKSQTPEDAVETLRNLIEMVPSPQNERDRGRLRAFNEALTALDQGEYTGTPQTMDVPPGGTPQVPQGPQPKGRQDGTNSFTPGGGSQVPHDIGMGTTRMSIKTSAFDLELLKDTVEQKIGFRPELSLNLPSRYNKGAYFPDGFIFWRPQPEWDTDGIPAHETVLNALIDLFGYREEDLGSCFFIPEEIEIFLESSEVTESIVSNVYNLLKGLGFTSNVFISNTGVDDTFSFAMSAPPIPPNDGGSITALKKMSTAPLTELPPAFNARAIFDLMKYVELNGEDINWDVFKSTSKTNPQDLASMLEVLTEIGVLRTADENELGGRFFVDRLRLESLLKDEKKENRVDVPDQPSKGVTEASRGLRTNSGVNLQSTPIQEIYVPDWIVERVTKTAYQQGPDPNVVKKTPQEVDSNFKAVMKFVLDLSSQDGHFWDAFQKSDIGTIDGEIHHPQMIKYVAENIGVELQKPDYSWGEEPLAGNYIVAGYIEDGYFQAFGDKPELDQRDINWISSLVPQNIQLVYNDAPVGMEVMARIHWNDNYYDIEVDEPVEGRNRVIVTTDHIYFWRSLDFQHDVGGAVLLDNGLIEDDESNYVGAGYYENGEIEIYSPNLYSELGADVVMPLADMLRINYPFIHTLHMGQGRTIKLRDTTEKTSGLWEDFQAEIPNMYEDEKPRIDGVFKNQPINGKLNRFFTDGTDVYWWEHEKGLHAEVSDEFGVFEDIIAEGGMHSAKGIANINADEDDAYDEDWTVEDTPLANGEIIGMFFESGQVFSNVEWMIESGLSNDEVPVVVEKQARDITERLSSKIAEADHDGAMIALKPPAEVVEKLKDLADEPDNLHVTLAYIPSELIDGIEEDELVEAIKELIRDKGDYDGEIKLPIMGSIGGFGTFNNDKHVLWAAVDIPHIDDLRHEIADLMENGKEGVPLIPDMDDLDQEHGFTPHMTLQYQDEPFKELPDMPEGLDKKFEWELSVVYQDNWTKVAIHYDLNPELINRLENVGCSDTPQFNNCKFVTFRGDTFFWMDYEEEVGYPELEEWEELSDEEAAKDLHHGWVISEILHYYPDAAEDDFEWGYYSNGNYDIEHGSQQQIRAHKIAETYVDEVREIFIEVLDDDIDEEYIDYYSMLAMTKGTDTTLEDVHDAWSFVEEDDDHESLIPFGELDEETKELDRPYMEAIHETARRIKTAARDNIFRIQNLSPDTLSPDEVQVSDSPFDFEDPSRYLLYEDDRGWVFWPMTDDGPTHWDFIEKLGTDYIAWGYYYDPDKLCVYALDSELDRVKQIVKEKFPHIEGVYLGYFENFSPIEEPVASSVENERFAAFSIPFFLKFTDRTDVERKADNIYNQGGVEFVSATPDPDRGRTLWEFNVTSTSGETYPLYGDTTMDNPAAWIDWFDVACSCDWGRWNYDRAPEYRYLERFPCSHALATEKWLAQSGRAEQDRSLREMETNQVEIRYPQEPEQGRRPRPGDVYREQMQFTPTEVQQRDLYKPRPFNQQTTTQPPQPQIFDEEPQSVMTEVPPEEQTEEPPLPGPPPPAEEDVNEQPVLRPRIPLENDEKTRTPRNNR